MDIWAPFTAGFDDLLATVDDLDIGAGVHGHDIAGIEPAGARRYSQVGA